MILDEQNWSATEEQIQRNRATLASTLVTAFAIDVVNGYTSKKTARYIDRELKKANLPKKLSEAVKKDMQYNTYANYQDIDKVLKVPSTSKKLGFDKAIDRKVDLATRKYAKSFNSIQSRYAVKADELANKVVSGELSISQAKRDFKTYTDSREIRKVRTLTGSRQMDADDWIRMYIRTEHNKTSWDSMERYMKANDLDVIEMSKHRRLKPRPLCEPYEGTLFSLSGARGTIKDIDGRDIPFVSVSDTSYGEPAGANGINCRHTFAPFVEGFSTLSS